MIKVVTRINFRHNVHMHRDGGNRRAGVFGVGSGGLKAFIAVLAAALMVLSGGSLANAAPSATAPVAASVAPDVTQSAATQSAVQPATLVGFNPGNIMSDAVFYDGAAMTVAQIQAFLNARIGTCQNGKCLNVLPASFTSRAAVVSARTGNQVCAPISGGTMSVAEVIYRAQVACGISAKVILVTLQKEQGLVTSRAPSDWNLRAAMGAFCPDTAPCDPAYAGVGPQIIAGVTQLKTYRAGAFARQPGVHSIGFHPNAACGAMQLLIANYATAALYNYTPYQPNAAALAAGYGASSDPCASYGNRNFYNYFTDWFGSTQTTGKPIVKAGMHIYVVSDGVRYHVQPADLAAFTSVFGGAMVVSNAYLDNFTEGPKASLYVRNNGTGEVAYLTEGSVHKFANCAQVAAWGGTCATSTRLAAADFSKFRRGAAITDFARVSAGGRLHRIEGTTLVPIYDAESAAMIAGGQTPYAAVMPTTAAAAYTVRPAVQFAPGRFIRTDSSATIYLPQTSGTLLRLPSWSLAADLGLPNAPYRVVKASAIVGNPVGPTMSAFVTCNGQTSLASGGSLRVLDPAIAAGFPTTMLDAATCARLKVSSAAPLTRLFVVAAGVPYIYMLHGGALRHVSNYSLYTALGGTTMPRVQVSADALNAMPKGDPVNSVVDTVAGDFVRGLAGPETYLATRDGWILHLPSWSFADELGLSRSVTMLTAAEIATLRPAGGLTHWANCQGQSYVAAGGVLHPVTGAAATGFSPTSLSEATCLRLHRLGSAPIDRVFVKADGGTAVYLAEAGAYRHVTSLARLRELGGGKIPPVLLLSPATVAHLPMGPTL